MMSDQSQALNLDEVYAFARDVASSAGQLLLDSLEKRRNGSSAAVEFSAEKENAVDIVTKTDQGKKTPHRIAIHILTCSL